MNPPRTNYIISFFLTYIKFCFWNQFFPDTMLGFKFLLFIISSVRKEWMLINNNVLLDKNQNKFGRGGVLF